MPESAGCNEVKYNLNVDTIEAIFRTYPAGIHVYVCGDKLTSLSGISTCTIQCNTIFIICGWNQCNVDTPVFCFAKEHPFKVG